ncbi:PAS domain S-box-containing protein [Desulfatibacillum alkenivorans DSM 16219]|jgi:PAS domain S-box-containing protein|uniref:histidine kinase n=1 Tax=Desulfatibacillum alkenivorans DSM 16219 TaxID=1121393 RepID=A0A1M6QQ83_9BACT|nr:PAS domain S-box protein [Desulfatibacillum alkenivorans]SHK22187.1 PAS domain S-box-containing protein [Desulfatibacillum alkenivorans DSM 16219]
MPEKPCYKEPDENLRLLKKPPARRSSSYDDGEEDRIKYKNLFEDAPIGIGAVEKENRITSANPCLCRLLGRRKDELVGLRFEDIAHPDDYQQIKDFVEAKAAKGLPLSSIRREVRLLKKDGQYVWTELVTSAMEYEDGQLSFGMGMIVDLSERKHTEQALKQSEKRYRSIYSQSPIAIELFDRNGVLLDVNQACLDIFGVQSIESVQEHNLFDARSIPPEQQEILQCGEPVRFQTIFDFEVVKKHHLYPTSKNGKIWLDVFITPTGPPNFEYLLQIQDITLRKLTEIKLQESESRWKFALEGAGDGVWDWNVQTSEVYFSNQWKAMLGYNDEDIGPTLEEWEKRVHPEDRKETLEDVRDHLSGKTRVYQNEHRVLCKDGSYKWVLDRGKTVERSGDGTPLRVIGTHSDISDRKEWELEREHLIQELRQTLDQVKTLSGLLPICSFCKKIRNDEGSWDKLESYIQKHSEATFSHGVCKECAKIHYPELKLYEE